MTKSTKDCKGQYKILLLPKSEDKLHTDIKNE